MAGETEALHARDHLWHLSVAGRLADADAELFIATRSTVVDLSQSGDGAVGWWERLTADGGEGMVVKPLGEPPAGRKVQPGLKCRGQEYLRIIYGPDYQNTSTGCAAAHWAGNGRWRCASTHSASRPSTGWWRVSRCGACTRPCFAVLALESEPVDPRL